MMSKLKRFVSIPLFVLIVLSMFSGCGSGDAAPANTSAATAAPAAASTASAGTDEQKEITYLMWGEPTRTGSMQKLADEFTKKNPGITVKIDNAGDNFGTKLNTLVAAGTPPDSVLVNELFGAGLYANKFYANIADYIKNDNDFRTNVYDKVAKPVKSPFELSDTEIYALPTMNYVTLLFYNKDMFDKAGLAYPDDTWTWDTFKKSAKALTITDGKNTSQYGTFFTRLIVYEQSWFFSNGASIISKDRSTCDIDSPAAIEAFKFCQDLIHVDKSAPIPDTTGGSQVSSISFDTGKVAMQIFGSWMIPTYATLPFNWGVASVPQGPKGAIPAAFPNGLGIGYGSKNQDAAWEWIKFCTSEDGQRLISQEGLAQPTLEAIMDSDTFMKASEKADMSIVKSSLLKSQGPNAVARWAEIGGNSDSFINSALDRIYIYNEDAEKVLKEAAANCNKVLEEVKAGKVQG